MSTKYERGWFSEQFSAIPGMGCRAKNWVIPDWISKNWKKNIITILLSLSLKVLSKRVPILLSLSLKVGSKRVPIVLSLSLNVPSKVNLFWKNSYYSLLLLACRWFLVYGRKTLDLAKSPDQFFPRNLAKILPSSCGNRKEVCPTICRTWVGVKSANNRKT